LFPEPISEKTMPSFAPATTNNNNLLLAKANLNFARTKVTTKLKNVFELRDSIL